MGKVIAVAAMAICVQLPAFAQQTNISRGPLQFELVGTWCDISGETAGFELRVDRSDTGATIVVHTVGYDENGNRVVLTEIGAAPEKYNPNGLFHSVFIYNFHQVTAGPGNDYHFRDRLFVLDDVTDDADVLKYHLRSAFRACSEGQPE